MTRSLKELIRTSSSKKKETPTNSNQTTFIVEALLLMMCLMMVIAVSVSVIAYSVQSNEYYSHKEAAITFASNTAEKFAVDPTSMKSVYIEDDLRAVCEVVSFPNDAGILYDATITVEWNGTRLYQMDTAQYVAAPIVQRGGDDNGEDKDTI